MNEIDEAIRRSELDKLVEAARVQKAAERKIQAEQKAAEAFEKRQRNQKHLESMVAWLQGLGTVPEPLWGQLQHSEAEEWCDGELIFRGPAPVDELTWLVAVRGIWSGAVWDRAEWLFLNQFSGKFQFALDAMDAIGKAVESLENYSEQRQAYERSEALEELPEEVIYQAVADEEDEPLVQLNIGALRTLVQNIVTEMLE